MTVFCSQAFLFDLSTLLVIIGIILLLKRKWRIVSEFLLILYFSIYSFAQSVHYLFFSNLFSYRKLSLASELDNVKSEVLSGLKVENLLFLIPVILMLVALVFLLKDTDNAKFKKRLIVGAILVIFGLSIHFGYVQVLRSDYKTDNSWNKDYYLHQVMQNRYKYMDRFGLLEFNVKDILMTTTPPKSSVSDDEMEEIDKFVSDYSYRESNQYTDIFEGKNLILILCESFDESAIDEELTPTLYKLKSESYYFNNHYAPLYEVATGDSEFISQTGMLPSINNGTTSYTFNLNSYPYALANLFKNKGYEANSYHSYTGNFYNRESLHESLGYSTFYDMDKLNLERYPGYKEATTWILDEYLFEGMIENTDFSKPFFNFVVTVSGHMSYNSGRIELKEYYDIVNTNERFKDLDEESKYYLAAQISLDRGIEKLLKGLEENDSLDNTIIYMFADHYPYGIVTEEGKQNILGGVDDYHIYKVPMLIYGTDLKPTTFDKITSTFDIYPTICNLFGLDDSKAYKVGKDVFSDGIRYVPFMDRSFLCDYFYYDSSKDTIVEDEYIDIYNKISSEINDIFYYSQEILLCDYYK